MRSLTLSRAAVLGLLVVGAACAEQGGPLGSESPPAPRPAELARLDCTVSTRERTLRCSGPAAAGDARSVIVGGQGQFVFLQASNHLFLPGDNVYSIDVTVQNLIGQALGTTDGTAVDEAGVRVFFEQEPVATEGVIAPISVLNETGSALFMRADQLFFQYDEKLETDQTSQPKTWEFSVDPGTTRFRFTVYVAAQVQHPHGWISVTPGMDTITAGGTQALGSRVLDVVGRELPGQAVAWGTSDAAVATVDAAGLVTAVAPGTATITTASGLRSGSTTIQVCPSLAVGEAYTVSMPQAAGLCFEGGASGAEYTYMPLNLSATGTLALSVTGSGIVGVAGPPSPAMMPARAGVLNLADHNPAAGGEDWHGRHLEAQSRELRGLVGRPGALVSPGARPTGGRRLITRGPAVVVGDLMTLNTASGCAGTRADQTGRVMAVSQRIILVADTLNPAGGFTTAQYDSIALEFDTLAYPVNVDNFGAPTDLDGNGRVVAFYTRTVNLLSPPGSGSIVGGYVNARDLFSANPTGSCPRSNEGELFYMRVPDPTGSTGNVAQVSAVRQGTVATLGHEFQHLINASRRIYLHNAGLETVWLNEGLSHVAEELMFYGASGLATRANIGLSTITASNQRINAYNSYMNQNVSRYRQFLLRPDTSGAFKNSDVLAVRGATWSFLRYAADRRNGDDAALWSALVNTSLTGTANLQNVLGSDPDTWLRDWIGAVYADDAVPGAAAQYTMSSWNMRSLYSGIFTRTYPLLPRPLTNGVAMTINFSAGGGTSYFRFGVPANAFAGVSALSAGLPPTSPYALIVMRTK